MSPRTKHLVPISTLACAVLLVACETTTTSSASRRVEQDPATGERVVVEERVITEQQEPDVCDGLVSCTFDFAGEVIAFPFRLVGGLLTAIF